MPLTINKCFGEIRVGIEKLPSGWSGMHQIQLERNVVDVCLGGGNTLAESRKKVCVVELVGCGGITVAGGDKFYREIAPLVKAQDTKAIEKVTLRRLGEYFAAHPADFVRMLKTVQEGGKKIGRSELQGQLAGLIMGD